MNTNKKIVAFGYTINTNFSNGMDKKQSLYNDFIPCFNEVIESLEWYVEEYPLNPSDRDAYMRQFRIFKSKISELKVRFMDGIINLNEAQLMEFQFLVAREIHEIFYEMYEKLKIKFSYPKLHQHFFDVISGSIFMEIYKAIPASEYHAYSKVFPQRKQLHQPIECFILRHNKSGTSCQNNAVNTLVPLI